MLSQGQDAFLEAIFPEYNNWGRRWYIRKVERAGLLGEERDALS